VFLLVLIVTMAHLHSASSYSIDCKLDPDSEDCVGRHKRNVEGSGVEGSGCEGPDCDGSGCEPDSEGSGCEDEDEEISGDDQQFSEEEFSGSGDGNRDVVVNGRRKRNASPFFDDED